MKKYLLILALVAAAGCKKADLQLNNPNSPTLASLKTKTGLEYYALGIFQKSNAIFDLPFFSSFIMGDEEISSVGNFGNRYQGQVTGITLPAPYNTTVPNIFGVTQTQQLQSLNSFAADAAGSNTFQYLWDDVYGVNGQANILLSSLGTAGGVLPANEKATLQAWCYWWKGIAYSMLGSYYSQGIITDAADGSTNGNYVSHDAIITEANANFDKAIAILGKIPDGDADYQAALTAVTPSFNAPDLAITPAMWIRNAYTYEARNILVNIKLKDMTAANWATVSALAAKGLVEGDQAFSRGLDPNGVNDMTAVTQGHPFLWNNNTNNPGWAYTSERFVQEFKTVGGAPVTATGDADGNITATNVIDARFAKGVLLLPTPVVNIRSRGIQFGSRFTPRGIEDGGYWTTGTAHLGQHLYTGSWEENTLMIAEADIHTGNIEAGLALVDKVRTEQGAGLPAVTGKGLTLAQAAEELRQERRIALYMRGIGWYDARRVGFTAPKSAGGGRANAMVLVPNSYTGLAGPTILPCFLEYNYMDYWDIPVDETAYNVPTSKTSAN